MKLKCVCEVIRHCWNCDFTFQCLMDPGLSPCEVEARRLNRWHAEACLRSVVETPNEAVRLEELVLQQGKDVIVHGVNTCSREPQVHEDWVHSAEQVPSLLIKALPYVSNKAGMECVEFETIHNPYDHSCLPFLSDMGWFSNLVENLAFVVIKTKLLATQLFTNRKRGSLEERYKTENNHLSPTPPACVPDNRKKPCLSINKLFFGGQPLLRKGL